MSEIPKRPEMDPNNYKGEIAFLDALIDHEHAIAKRAVGALRAVWSDAVHMPRDEALVEIRNTVDTAIAQISASGWTP